MTDSQNEDHQPIVTNVVDDPAVANANTELAVTTAHLQASWRS
ncbi:hypothetical protein JOF28_001405 [Leucobacter exalbidus]|uniref:Uncharacterized protein n=1 Tax=Leucobacter exalbidus TaxID=662960 RepID=A0A940PSV8_9MICO|nr:hypothetical protein [Leucobacter exalbidus]